MKNRYISFVVLLFVIGLMSFVNSKSYEIKKYKAHFPNGIDANLSGSPGNDNCSNCHGANVQSGNTMNILTLNLDNTPVLEYIPGETYVVSLEMSANPAARGFNAVVMNSDNENVGTFETIPDAVTDGARASNGVATHNTNSNAANWQWTWIAPSTSEGDVTFYVATLKSDGGFTTYLSQHTFTPNSGGIEEKGKSDKYNFSAGYSSQNNTVAMSFNSLIAGEMVFNLVDLTGRSVFYYKMGSSKVGKNQEKIVLPENLKNGSYIVNMSVNNNFMEQQIIIQK